MRILEIELGQPLPIISAFDDKTGKCYQRASCLVRLHGQPLGIVAFEFVDSLLDPELYAEQIWFTLKEKINEHMQQDGLPSVIELNTNGLYSHVLPRCIEEREQFLIKAPFVSVVVPTHNRPEQLAACLSSLLSLSYPDYEVIVVDNAPGTNVTADLVQKLSVRASQLRYVREDNPGPSWARNRGITIAKGKILVFADDDVVVDPFWLVELVKGFSIADNVACVSGLVLPLELETPAQFLFEEHGGFSKGFNRRIFKLKMEKHYPDMSLHPYTPGRYAAGASMAFTSDFLHKVGGFDPALGGNGPSRNGQDIAIFFKVIVEGYTLVYEPRALLYHLHRRDYAELSEQIYRYGIGLTAYLTKIVFDNPLMLVKMISKIPYGFFLIFSSQSSKNSKKLFSYSKNLTLLERKGMLYGPFAYVQSRWLAHKMRKAFSKDSSYPIGSKES